MGGMKDAYLGDTLERDYVTYQRHSETSRQAARSVASYSGRDRSRVLEYLEQHPEGATDEQIGDALDLPGNTLRPRRRELQQASLIIDSGRHASTRSGRKAVVWILKPQSDLPSHSRWWQHD